MTMVMVQIAAPAWRKHRGVAALIRRAATAALGRTKRPVTILLTTDARMKALNFQFRGRNKPTNVLSFPSPAADYLGDIAMGHAIVAREAKAQGKTFAAHAAHLVAHGVLHLMGHDHENPEEAARMEGKEIRLLRRLKIANPYNDLRPLRTVAKGRDHRFHSEIG